MPVYHDQEHRHEPTPWPLAAANPPPPLPPSMHRTSEESIRTEFCEGPLPEDAMLTSTLPTDHHPSQESNGDAGDFSRLPVRDRAELIERIKRAQNPAWWTESVKDSPPLPVKEDEPILRTTPIGPQASLLPAIKLKGPISPEEAARCEEARASSLQAGREIQRPRSALHTGDFTEASNSRAIQPQTPPATRPSADHPLPSSTKASSSPSIDISRPKRTSFSSQQPPVPSRFAFGYTPPPARQRAPSFHSAGFVYKVPTSPLVQQESNDDLDDHMEKQQSSHKDSRRRTLPPDSFHNFRSMPSTLAQAARQPGSFQIDTSFSSQNRGARRSSNVDQSFLASVSPPTPRFLRSRGTSFSGEASPLQPSSMVGSYEESILRGRMSTTPSKPVDFTAQIGALGKADCKPRFPDHVTLNFPAVYYNWNSSEAADLPSMAEPSPYVGQIDLENGLPTPKRRERRSERDQGSVNADAGREAELTHEPPPEGTRRRTRSISPSKRPPGGSYRIPQRGQLQILIKNPNKTAVKLFLVPYDLEGMEPGTKTFIRQNAYSAGPIIEGLRSISAGSDAASEVKFAQRTQRPTLRYSIHLHICCPSKGRYYLYKSIKVVFANRVPDNKERLRNDIRLPEPRYSPYRPNDVQSSPSVSAFRRSFDKENRRRSFQMPGSFENSPRSFHQRFPSSGLGSPPPLPLLPPSMDSHELGILIDANPNVPKYQQTDHVSTTRESEQAAASPPEETSTPFGTDLSSSMYSTSSNNSADSAYSKLSKGDIGYGGLFARPGTPEASEGLLSRRLRRMEVDRSKAPSKQ